MHARTSLAVLLAAPVIALPASPSSADPAGPPVGRTCSIVSVGDPSTGQQHLGRMDGGPLAAPGHPISIRCSVHVGNVVHSGAAADTAEAGPEPHVVVLPPTPISNAVVVADTWAVCTEATVGTTTWYWDGTAWTADSGAPCATIRRCPPDCLPPAVEAAFGEVVDTLDRTLPGSGDLARCFDPWTQHSTCVEALLGVLCRSLVDLGPGVPGVIDVEEDGDLHVLGAWLVDCPPEQV
jgi:hypothetical protein